MGHEAKRCSVVRHIRHCVVSVMVDLEAVEIKCQSFDRSQLLMRLVKYSPGRMV